ncbi:phosphoenolpyruvate--protein phosphotransferase [Micromonospora sp. LZ34]
MDVKTAQGASSTEAAPLDPGARRIVGLGVSPGAAHAPVVHMADDVSEPAASAPLDPEGRDAAVARLYQAAREVQADLLTRAEEATRSAKAVLSATAMMAVDPILLGPAKGHVLRDGVSPARATWLAAAEVESVLAGAGEMMAARIADLRDVRDRLVCALEGRVMPGLPRRDTPFVLVARDLAPADTAALDGSQVVALVTEEGGPTSHTAILARAMGIPAVVGAAGATTLAEGEIVLVDATAGTVEIMAEGATVSPSPSATRSPVATFDGVGATADGCLVPLLANVGDPGAAQVAVDVGAEGVGLFRTEFCFLGRAAAPSVAEQVSVYRQIFSMFPGRKVVARTLDAGSDKPLPFLTGVDEPNPALGVRGFRTAVRFRELLDAQLDALAEAARETDAEVWVMAPMVSTPSEAARFVAAAKERGLRAAGVMIEVPALAIQADQTVATCDFVSIGTNDLTQYVMAADRQLGEVASFNDPWQPAVLHLVARTCTAAQAHAKPVSVCGEAAADPDLACVLVGLGVTSLSMTPRAIPAVAARLAAAPLDACQEAARQALQACTADEARAAVRQLLDENGRPKTLHTPTGGTP